MDDEPRVRDALCRILAPFFGGVCSASRVEQADKLLSSQNVTHLLCDYWLGKDSPNGLELIQLWRRQYPFIERAVLITGVETRIHADPLFVDAVISKLSAPKTLLDALSGNEERILQ